MTCDFAFLQVGNADSICITPVNGSAVVVDVPKPAVLRRWLERLNNPSIGRIYITHAHDDHFSGLSSFVAFLANWFDSSGFLGSVILPWEVIPEALAELRRLKSANQQDSAEYKRLHYTISRLESWRGKKFNIVSGRRSENVYQHDGLKIEILHPESLFHDKHILEHPSKRNERSLALRVQYGQFAAILLADLEGAGLTECRYICDATELRAHLVKIPHHGAWPRNGTELTELLEAIDAEIAVLSVGSSNPYGHVHPTLFLELLRLRDDAVKRLSMFLCTEVTQTCACSAQERAEPGRRMAARKCAGDIVITARLTGDWDLNNALALQEELSRVTMAACQGRADLAPAGSAAGPPLAIGRIPNKPT